VAPVNTENGCARFEPSEVGLLWSEDSGAAETAAEEMAEDSRRYAGAFALGKGDAKREFLFVGHGKKWCGTGKQAFGVMQFVRLWTVTTGPGQTYFATHHR
jgi:hypothetical protein